MAYSWQESVKPAGTQDIQCDIEYLDKSYIHVYLDGAETTAFTWTSSTNIRLNSALSAETVVLLIRKTAREYLYIAFASGAPFIEGNVDTQNKQFLHLAQELVEGRAIEGFYGDISFNGYRITNVGTPEKDTDAANKAYVDTTVRSEAVLRAAADAKIQQDVDYNELRSLRFPEGVEEMPGVAGRANSLQGYNDTGKPIPIFNMTATADLAMKLASSGDDLGAGLVGYDVASSYSSNTVGKKLNLLLSPWDFGAVADGTLHPLSEYYTTLAAAQAVYPFVTSLDQSIDYAAMQKCVNAMITRGAAGMTMGGRGRFCINSTVQFNKTGSVNEANKTIDFSGALIESYCGAQVLNDTIFTSWTLQGGVTVDSGKLVFAGDSATQAQAAITLTGLTVGKSYAVSVRIETYTSTGYLRIRLNGTPISRANEAGPGVRHAEFTATATTHVLQLRDDTWTGTPAHCIVSEVDVRELAYPLRFYQLGTAITHGSVAVYNLRIYNRNSAGFGGLRADNLNHAAFNGVTSFVGFYGPGMHMCNTLSWSENDTVDVLLAANCREAIRFTRPVAGTGLNSFARTNIKRIVFAGCRYAAVFEVGTSVYDSVIGSVSGNLTSNFRAIFSLHGDQSSSVVESIRVENNSAPSTAGIFEYGLNDLRRINLRAVGFYLGIPLLAANSWAAGTVSLENTISGTDFRPARPYFGATVHLPPSGTLGIGAVHSAGTYTWSEILLAVEPATATAIGGTYGLTPAHGVVELDISLRNADGTSMQGTKHTIKLMKATVFGADVSKVVVYDSEAPVNSELITVTWPANSAPRIAHSAAEARSIQVYARWTV